MSRSEGENAGRQFLKTITSCSTVSLSPALLPLASPSLLSVRAATWSTPLRRLPLDRGQPSLAPPDRLWPSLFPARSQPVSGLSPASPWSRLRCDPDPAVCVCIGAVNLKISCTTTKKVVSRWREEKKAAVSHDFPSSM